MYFLWSSCRVTNPHEFEVDGLTFLGTSGQNVEDIYKYSTREDRLKILEALLEWGHLVPTAPDTLGSYPYAMDDPFLLDTAPHVAFAGNQPTFQTSIVTGKHFFGLLALYGSLEIFAILQLRLKRTTAMHCS